MFNVHIILKSVGKVEFVATKNKTGRPTIEKSKLTCPWTLVLHLTTNQLYKQQLVMKLKNCKKRKKLAV